MNRTVPTYDHIIVGAGAAGAVLAARLTEDRARHVLLLEAGPDLRWADCPSAMHDVNPFEIVAPHRHEAFRWVQLKARRTAAQRAFHFWRGRGLGGSTAINGMFAVRGEPDDYEDWANDGSPGWSWDDVLPWFIRLEDDLDYGGEPYHGRGGPYPIWRPPLEGWAPLDIALREAALDAGHPWCDDHNAPRSTGLAPYAASIRDGVRVSTNDAYIEPARDRQNLTIVGDALADAVVVESGRARAIDVITNGRRERFGGGEIILAAGAVHSPAILLRSGIGDAQQLMAQGIEVVAARPGVGANLSDHPFVLLGVVGPDDDSWQAASRRHSSSYLRYSSGLAGTGANDMMVVPLTFPTGTAPGFPSMAGIGVSIWQPFSRGQLTLASTDPAVDPRIDENMLDDQRDRTRLRDGIRRVIDLLSHDAFAPLRTSEVMFRGLTHAEPVPSSPTDGDLDDIAQRTAGDLQHIVGTCRMGDPDDEHTVVDPSGRVVGVEGLRVIDASIIPACPRANTALTTIMLAEKLSASIRHEG